MRTHESTRRGSRVEDPGPKVGTTGYGRGGGEGVVLVANVGMRQTPLLRSGCRLARVSDNEATLGGYNQYCSTPGRF